MTGLGLVSETRVRRTVPPHTLLPASPQAFLNWALRAAGLDALAHEHSLFYARVQRRTGALAGSFAMNYFASGVAGGPIPIELDETGLGLHARAAQVDLL